MFLFVLFSISSGEWVETTQEDFKDGWYEVNLYSSHRGGGAVEFSPRWDANNDGWIDILSVQVYGGSRIFWGAKEGFSDDNSAYFSNGIGGGAFADLNTDGYTDFIITGPLCTHIYWGEEEGPNPQNYTTLNEGEEACFVADFNKDGYLDIAFDYADSRTAGIYWGTSNGYSNENVTHLPVIQTQHNIEAADFNKDGWLDLLLPNQYGDHNTIYWGCEEGFSTTNKKDIPFLTSYIHGTSVADLDGDGWLDLVFTGNYDINEAWVYWGPEFLASDKTILPTGECYGGSAIADLNRDGLLDIVFFRGARSENSYQTRIQWGNGSRFKESSSSLVGPYSRASGGLIADFNQDGNLDIFFNSYNEASPVLWGPNYTADGATYLHGGIDHHGMAREIGDLYTRELKETYYSSVYDTKMDLSWIETEWEGSTPGSSKIRIAVRTGAHPDDFNNPILLASASDPWIEITDDKSISDILMGCNQRYIQYRATFEYDNPACLPSLSWVKISYEGNSIEETQQPVEYEGDALPGSDLCVTRNSGYSQWSISFTPDASGPIDLAIYDIRGSRVRSLINSETVSGTFTYTWEGTDDNGKTLPSGAYFVHLTQPEMRQIAKVILMH